MGVVGELATRNDRFRRVAFCHLPDIVKSCCAISGCELPKKVEAGLAEACVKYLRSWNTMFATEYPQLQYLLQAVPKKQEEVTAPSLEERETAVQKAKVIFDLHNSEFRDCERSIELALHETRECLHLYHSSARPLSHLSHLPADLFTVDLLRSVFAIDPRSHGLERTQARTLLLGKLRENEKLIGKYEETLSNMYQHTEFALRTFPSDAEQYHGRAEFARKRVVKLMRDCQSLRHQCELTFAEETQS